MYLPSKPGSGLPEHARSAGATASVVARPPLLRLFTVERDGNPLRRYGHVSPHIGKLAPLDAEALGEIACLAAASLPAGAVGSSPGQGPGQSPGQSPGHGPTLVVGMAESALLLAWFLAERLEEGLGGEGRVDLCFTTRERRPASSGRGAARRAFLEPHSHGPVHTLVPPPGRSYARVVIVEDELTTGATLGNLLYEIQDISPRCHVVTLADGRPQESRERLRKQMRASAGVELSVADLSMIEDEPAPATRNDRSTTTQNPFGRPRAVMDGAVEELGRRWLALRPECLYAIGECVDVAMALWGSLQREKRPVFRHVTRSPWLVDGAAITSRLDLCAPPVPRHFLYNWAREAPSRRALLVGERSTAPVARRLRRFLRSRGVEAVSFEVPHA